MPRFTRCSEISPICAGSSSLWHRIVQILELLCRVSSHRHQTLRQKFLHSLLCPWSIHHSKVSKILHNARSLRLNTARSRSIARGGRGGFHWQSLGPVYRATRTPRSYIPAAMTVTSPIMRWSAYRSISYGTFQLSSAKYEDKVATVSGVCPDRSIASMWFWGYAKRSSTQTQGSMIYARQLSHRIVGFWQSA